MIDPFKETMLALAKAARRIPGRSVSKQTLYTITNATFHLFTCFGLEESTASKLLLIKSKLTVG